MNAAVQAITWQGLVFAAVPAAVVIAIMWYWRVGAGEAIYANARMLAQLLLIGYVLVFIFEAGEPSIVLAILAVMVIAASYGVYLWVNPSRTANDRLRDLGVGETGEESFDLGDDVEGVNAARGAWGKAVGVALKPVTELSKPGEGD